MESYVPNAAPWTPAFNPQDAPPYFIKHNPFSSFSSIVHNQERWRRIDNEAGLFADLLNGKFRSMPGLPRISGPINKVHPMRIANSSWSLQPER